MPFQVPSSLFCLVYLIPTLPNSILELPLLVRLSFSPFSFVALITHQRAESLSPFHIRQIIHLSRTRGAYFFEQNNTIDTDHDFQDHLCLSLMPRRALPFAYIHGARLCSQRRAKRYNINQSGGLFFAGSFAAKFTVASIRAAQG